MGVALRYKLLRNFQEYFTSSWEPNKREFENNGMEFLIDPEENSVTVHWVVSNGAIYFESLFIWTPLFTLFWTILSLLIEGATCGKACPALVCDDDDDLPNPYAKGMY